MVQGSGAGTFTTDKSPALLLLLSGKKLGYLPGKEYLKPSIQGGSPVMVADMLSTVSDYFSLSCQREQTK